MKKSIIIVDNVANNLPQRTMLQNTDEKFMKGSNILADNAVNNSLKQDI